MTATSLDGTTHGLDPRQRTVWAVASALPGVVLGIAGVVLGLVAELSGAVLAGVAVLVVWPLLAVVAAALSWRRWTWSAWPDALELRHGVVVARASLVPYQRIQQIDVSRGPLERALGLSRLVLRTASATSDGELPGIPAEQADELRRHLLRRAGLDDAV
jgi:membrane protein YdbS with pleckstrin-like domain